MMTGRGDIGGKAETLSALASAGLPVPDARFLATRSYEEHARRAGIASLIAGGPVDAAAVRHAIETTEIDAALADVLRRWHFDLGGGDLAVRSSGSAEDLPEASFAGQHGTYFVSEPDDLPDRVRDCWASLFSDRAVAYRERQGIPHDGVAMAVIVQRLVPASCAGVAFTASPLDGSADVLVESCFGLGEALVSGKVAPDSFVVSRETGKVVCATAGTKPVRIAKSDGGEVTEHALSPSEAAALSADEATVERVARLALRAEGFLGAPADVEWAFDGKQVWLLQARPITTLGRPGPAAPAPEAAPVPPPEPAAADSAAPVAEAPPAPTPPPPPPQAPVDASTPIWSNVNTGEILPDVATPMTWSIIHGHANDLFGGMFGALGVRIDATRLIGLVAGRVYFDLSKLRGSFSHLPGFDPDVALGGMHEFVELPELPPAPPGPGWPGRLRAAVALPRYIARHTPRKAAAFAARARRMSDAASAAAASHPDAATALATARGLEATFGELADAVAFMAVGMFGYGLLTGLTHRWLGDASGALAAKLVAGRGDVVSAQAGHAMWRLGLIARERESVRLILAEEPAWADAEEYLQGAAARGDAGAKEFLDAWELFMLEHGHHRRGELEFANPTWAETPDYVLGVVASYMAGDPGADPMAAYAERAAEADEAAEKCRARLRGVKRAAFDRALRWGRSSAGTRENIKNEAVRWLVAMRAVLLSLGERLAETGAIERADDVFFLTFDELGPMVEEPGSADWRALVAGRRAERERLERLSPPPVVVGAWDESSGPWTPATDAATLTGISVSAGVARGPARVLATAGADEAVLPGEILVAPFTDPGWTPYFVPAAGIVMDMGGLLSHGSIIAREYGIPAVVNVGPATRIIRTGQIVEVDGDTGTVRILG